MKLEITLVVAAAAVLLNLWLSIRVGRVRLAEKVFVGDGGNEAVIRRMRAHANFIENAPFFLVLLAVIELASGSSIWLWGVSLLFVIARIAHAFGMDRDSKLRPFGVMMTMLILLGLALYALFIAYSGTVFTGTETTTSIAA
ncbi:MAPEG family protein [Parasphingopyxis lamellibrachiae]|uniref:MAPEG family protein n=1 Tax=Parasphingopyxis lamellibrachiae TaxID=680125 RepID=A0A3D9FII8_9SPHN|nr:MAPEG family protein [Parasphingopyxis lamellibrachiae]RED17438.1 hypothetical protein DFR46_2485 [Parasphingopyxis lamellibrachiae]